MKAINRENYRTKSNRVSYKTECDDRKAQNLILLDEVRRLTEENQIVPPWVREVCAKLRRK